MDKKLAGIYIIGLRFFLSAALSLGFVASVNLNPAQAAPAPSTFIITALPASTSSFGTSVELTVAVSGNKGPGAGTVQFLNGGVAIGSACTLVSGGCSSTVSGLEVGAHTFTGTYTDTSGNYVSGTYGSLAFSVTKASVTIVVTSRTNPSRLGDTTIFDATVSGAGISPTGTLQFKDGANNLGSAATLNSGAASISLSSLTIGSHSITATYSGDTNYNSGGTSNSVNQVVNKALSTVAVVSSEPTAILGDPLTFTITASGSQGSVIGGAVTLYAYETNTVIGTCSITTGSSCTIDLFASTPGHHRVWASYSGNSIYDPSNSPYIYQDNANPATPTVVVTFSPSSTVDFGTTVTANATVSGGSGTPSGIISWEMDENSISKSCTLATGSCSVSLTGVVAGLHTIVAEYGGDHFYAAGEGQAVLTVNTVSVATTTDMVASPSPSLTGATVTLTAHVHDTGLTPTGGVTFKDGITDIGGCTLALSICSITSSPLSKGSHVFTATYAGVAGEFLSSSGTFTQQVNDPTGKSTTTTLTISSSPVIGETETVTAHVTNSTTVTGTMIFKDATAEIGRCDLSSQSCSIHYAFAALGSHFVSANFQVSSEFDGSSVSATITVIKHTTTMDIISSENPSAWLQAPTFTVTMPTRINGSMIIEDGEGATSSCTITAGICTATLTFKVSGSHDMHFEYGGDEYNAALYVHFTQVVGLPTPVVTLTSNKAPADFSSPISFTATLSNVSATGAVTFREGSTPIASCTIVSGGSCSADFAGLSVGSHSLVADYAGQTGVFAGAQSATFTQDVVRATTTTTLVSSLNPSPYGTVLTLTATVINSGVGPTGVVQFEEYVGGSEKVLGQCTLTGSSCALTVSSSLSLGTHSLKAEYLSDTSYAGSYSSSLAQVINPISNGLSVVSSNTSALFGDAVTLYIFMNVTPGPATGTVQLSDGTNPLGSPLTLVDGRASYVTSSLAVGTHSIGASYSGDTTYSAASASPISQTISNTVTLALAQGKLSFTSGESNTYTATATSLSGTPTGLVTFEEAIPGGSDIPIGSCTLSSGSCTLTTSTLAVGSHSIYGEYGGEGTFGAALSSKVITTVVAKASQVPIEKPAPAATPVVATPKLQPSHPATFYFEPGSAAVIQVTATNTVGRTSILKLGVPAQVSSVVSYAVVSVSDSPKEALGKLAAIKVELFDKGDSIVRTLSSPITISLGRFGTIATPAMSKDGVTWTQLPRLTTAALPVGETQGWYQDTDGSMVVLTSETSYFDIKKGQGLLFVKASDRHITIGTPEVLGVAGGAGSGTATYTTTTPAVCSVTTSGTVVGHTAGRCMVTVVRASDGDYIAAVSKPLAIVIRK